MSYTDLIISMDTVVYKSFLGMNFDYHAVAAASSAAIPLAAGAAGVGYFIMRSKGIGFGTAHLLVGLPVFVVGAASAAFFLITK